MFTKPISNNLPSFYWNFIIDYLPNYSRRDDVLISDIFTRYLDGEDVLAEDFNYFFRHKTYTEIKHDYINNEWALFIEAFEAYSTYKYGDKIEKRATPNQEYFDKKTIIPQNNGSYYIRYRSALPQISTINDFIKYNIDYENFIYEVTGPMDDERMEHFNNLYKKVKRKGEICYDIATSERMEYLHCIGCDLRFDKPARDIARTNLVKCGGMEMPAIVAGMLKKFYYEDRSARTSIEDCICYLADNDVAGYGFDDLKATYRGKVAQLLLSTFTGMRLGTKWNGRQEVNGGYIVVKNDGDVVAFHSTIADEFKDFLVAKMIMESPSHSRHKDMAIYKEAGKYYIKLGLQLRFVLNR